MDRRNFLRTMLGVAAATALPSEVFPFRKIFLPEAPQIIAPQGFAPELIQAQLDLSTIESIEIEYFSKNLLDVFYRPSPFFTFLTNKSVPVNLTAAGMEMHMDQARSRIDMLDLSKWGT